MDIPDWMMGEEIKIAVVYDECIVMVSELIVFCWPSTKAEVQKDLQPYWTFRDEIAVIDGIAMRGGRIIIHAELQDKALKQF